jgi:hypothetical protein
MSSRDVTVVCFYLKGPPIPFLYTSGSQTFFQRGPCFSIVKAPRPIYYFLCDSPLPAKDFQGALAAT